MKRVGCLYRVSTKKQVSDKDDIPMQKQACTEFAEENGWIITKEFLEKGISGFKVKSDDRDVLQDLKESAMKREFDVLLVFMFDRLGRRDDETPFIVEWFVQQGIEVWSVKEGQQSFETHVDKLMNYIRFWQANGESRKTSERVKTRMAQLTAEGKFTGGAVPFGYRLVSTGQVNRKGRPINQLEINPIEAEYVRLIFNKTVNEGYGSYRMSEYLTGCGIKTHKGADFQSTTINRLLKNRIYCGYFVQKDIVSPKQEDLAIIDENIFDMAQDILYKRSHRQDEKSHIALTTKSSSVLSGCMVCGHCGTNIVAVKKSYKYGKVNGVPQYENRRAYICYHRTRNLNDCNGQGVYLAEKVERIVLKIVKDYLSKIKRMPKDRALELKYDKVLKEKQECLKLIEKQKTDVEEEYETLSAEIGKALLHKSPFTIEVLQKALSDSKKKIAETEMALKKYEAEIENVSEAKSKLDFYYEQFRGWADEFDNASPEQKKMIISQLFGSIKLSRGYEVDATLNTMYEQFFE